MNNVNHKIKPDVHELILAFAKKHGKKIQSATEELIVLGIKKHRELESKRR